MIIYEYGDSTLPIVLVLHPMLADATCVQNVTKSMNGNYCFIVFDFCSYGNNGIAYAGIVEEEGELAIHANEVGGSSRFDKSLP